MNTRTLITMLGGALVLIGGASWLAVTRDKNTEQQAALYPSLKEHRPALESIRIHHGGSQPAVELMKVGDHYVVAQRDRYPADPTRINALLDTLETTRLREQKTSNPSNYTRLGVQDVSQDIGAAHINGSASAPTTRLEIVGANVDLLIGRTDPATRTTYVRRNGENQSWLIDQELAVSPKPQVWLLDDIVDIAPTRIQAAELEVAGKHYSLHRAANDAKFDVMNLPKGREIESVSEANAVGRALMALTLEEVRARDTNLPTAVNRAIFKTFDGLVITVNAISRDAGDDRHWIALSASFDATLAQRFHARAADEEQAKVNPAQSLEALSKQISAEADSINQRTGNWLYLLPLARHQALFRPIDALLKPR
jgi:hypothetical protein